MEAFRRHLPPGVINFITGSGRSTVAPLMKSGRIDALAFIGNSATADAILREHPHPHRLTTYLGLEAKNCAFILADADIDVAVREVVAGSLSFNGQRCTALKLIFVHESIAQPFLTRFTAAVESLKVGLPWENGVSVTPLAEGEGKVQYLTGLIDDAVSKGARVLNRDGGSMVRDHSLLMRPAVLYPVTSAMDLWSEEQFGPVVPVATFSDSRELLDYLRTTPFGQQASVFTRDPRAAARLIDALGTVVGRVNLNTQCARSPDVLPFTGRRSSALGGMSVTQALRAFSIETVVATRDTDADRQMATEAGKVSKMIQYSP